MRPFCRKNHVHKIPRFRGGGYFEVFWGGGGSADFIFMGARTFLNSGRMNQCQGLFNHAPEETARREDTQKTIEERHLNSLKNDRIWAVGGSSSLYQQPPRPNTEINFFSPPFRLNAITFWRGGVVKEAPCLCRTHVQHYSRKQS